MLPQAFRLVGEFFAFEKFVIILPSLDFEQSQDKIQHFLILVANETTDLFEATMELIENGMYMCKLQLI
jgi:hypothetical protein